MATSEVSVVAKGSDARFYTLFFGLATAGTFQYAYSISYLNTPINGFKDYLNESLDRMGYEMTEGTYNWMWNLILNIWSVGYFFGIWLSPLLNDRYGRKGGFLAGHLLSLIASVLRSVAIWTWRPEVFFIGRLLMSIATAVIYSSLILFLQECSPTARRGVASSLGGIVFAIVCIIGTLLGVDEIFGRHLIGLMIFPLIPNLVFIILNLFVPETPKFLLLTRQNKERAEASVRFYHGVEADTKAVLREIAQEAVQIETSSTFKEMIKAPHVRKALFLSCAALQLTISMTAVLFLSTAFLKDVGLGDAEAEWSSTGMNVIHLFGTLLGCYLIDRRGRRPLLLWYGSANTVSLFVYVACAGLRHVFEPFKYGCLVAFLAFEFTYGVFGPVTWFLSSELVPQKYRSLVQSFSYALNTVISVAVTFSVMPLFDWMSAYCFLYLYVIPASLCIFYMYRNLPETRGREIHEVVRDLQRVTQRDDEFLKASSSENDSECKSLLLVHAPAISPDASLPSSEDVSPVSLEEKSLLRGLPA